MIPDIRVIKIQFIIMFLFTLNIIETPSDIPLTGMIFLANMQALLYSLALLGFENLPQCTLTMTPFNAVRCHHI
jgi:hypothetical protein